MVTSVLWLKITVISSSIHISLTLKFSEKNAYQSLSHQTELKVRISFIVYNFFPIIEHVFLEEENTLYKLSQEQKFPFCYYFLRKLQASMDLVFTDSIPRSNSSFLQGCSDSSFYCPRGSLLNTNFFNTNITIEDNTF